jgi:hypothetical protein
MDISAAGSDIGYWIEQQMAVEATALHSCSKPLNYDSSLLRWLRSS